jgi:hypothetical protein
MFEGTEPPRIGSRGQLATFGFDKFRLCAYGRFNECAFAAFALIHIPIQTVVIWIVFINRKQSFGYPARTMKAEQAESA